MTEEVEPGKPQYVLKNVLCVNCHSNSDRDTIKILGGARVPVVNNTVKPVKPLAGGNFYYVAKDFGDRKGHNVDGVTSVDTKFRGAPQDMTGYPIPLQGDIILKNLLHVQVLTAVTATEMWKIPLIQLWEPIMQMIAI